MDVSKVDISKKWLFVYCLIFLFLGSSSFDGMMYCFWSDLLFFGVIAGMVSVFYFLGFLRAGRHLLDKLFK